MPEGDELGALELEGQSSAPPAERPEWLADNFKSVEDAARSASEARRLVQEVTERNARNEELIQNLAMRLEEQGQPESPQSSSMPDPLTLALEEAIESGNAERVIAIQAHVADTVARGVLAEARQQQDSQGPSAEQSMFANMVEDIAMRKWGNDAEWEDLRPEVGRMIYSKGHMMRHTADPHEAAEDLLTMAKLAAMERGGTAPRSDNPDTGGLEASLRDAGVANDQSKRLAQSLGGAGARVLQADDDAAYIERVKAAKPLEWRG